MHDVVVIGGGIAGLTAAWDLMRAGLDVVVVEEKESAGGNIRTLAQEEYRLETGPHSFMGSSENVWRLVEELGIEAEVEKAAAVGDNRYIYRNEQLMPLPTSAGAFLGTRLLSFKAKMRLAVEPFIRNGAQPEETAWEFFRRRFGEEAATYIMSPFISGVYAGDINQLGARAAFPKFWQFEKETGSMIRGARRYMKAKKKRLKEAGVEYRKGMFTMPGGLGGLTRRVAQRLDSRLRLTAPVAALERNEQGLTVQAGGQTVAARSVVLAVPPDRAAAVLAKASPAAAELMRGIPMVPVALVHWTCANEPDEIPRGFGFLVPRVTGVRLLGTLFPSQLFSGRAPQERQLFASFYGGALDNEAMRLSDDALWELLLTEHRKILGVELKDPQRLRVLRHAHAIPQLLPDHPEKVEALAREVAGIPGLALAGNYLVGVGIEAAVESGYEAARRCREFLQGSNGKA